VPEVRSVHRRRRLLAAGIVAVAVSVAVTPVGSAQAGPRAASGGTVLVQETFTGARADSGFLATQDAYLTGAAQVSTPLAPGARALTGCPGGAVGPVPPNDAAPFGYLRLTDADTDRSAAVLYNEPLPSNEGLDVTFEQWQYGGDTTKPSPADGISFFLVDGAAQLTHPGAFGGSLGYAQKLPDDNPANTFLSGVDGGYLGVGLDVLGNFFGDWEHRGNGCTTRSPAGTGFRAPAPGANMVTVRGPGEGVDGYCFLKATTSNTTTTTTGPWNSTLPGRLQGPATAADLPAGLTPLQAQTALQPSQRTVTVHLSPGPNPQLTVDVDFSPAAGVRASTQVLSMPLPQPVPATLKFGFAASTGLFTDVHLLREVTARTVQALPQLNLVKQIDRSTPLPDPITAGTTIPYQFVVTNGGTVPITHLHVVDPVVRAVDCPVSTLAAGETTTCTGHYTITEADARRGYLANTAVAHGTADEGPVVSPESQVILPLNDDFGLLLDKRVDDSHAYHPGDEVTYTAHATGTAGERTAISPPDHATITVVIPPPAPKPTPTRTHKPRPTPAPTHQPAPTPSSSQAAPPGGSLAASGSTLPAVVLLAVALLGAGAIILRVGAPHRRMRR
jgi:hypothetical protein